jgi:hypothetical protein
MGHAQAVKAHRKQEMDTHIDGYLYTRDDDTVYRNLGQADHVYFIRYPASSGVCQTFDAGRAVLLLMITESVR